MEQIEPIYQVTLYSDYKSSQGRYAICDGNGDVLWYGKLFDGPLEQSSGEQLTGTIEADETFIGGSEKNKHAHKRTDNNQGRSVKTKIPVAGVVQRGGALKQLCNG